MQVGPIAQKRYYQYLDMVQLRTQFVDKMTDALLWKLPCKRHTVEKFLTKAFAGWMLTAYLGGNLDGLMMTNAAIDSFIQMPDIDYFAKRYDKTHKDFKFTASRNVLRRFEPVNRTAQPLTYTIVKNEKTQILTIKINQHEFKLSKFQYDTAKGAVPPTDEFHDRLTALIITCEFFGEVVRRPMISKQLFASGDKNLLGCMYASGDPLFTLFPDIETRPGIQTIKTIKLPAGTYFLDPPHIEPILGNLTHDIIHQLELGVTNDTELTFIMFLPVWDPEGQKACGIINKCSKWDTLEIIKKSQFAKEIMILDREKNTFWNPYMAKWEKYVHIYMVIMSNQVVGQNLQLKERILSLW